MQPPTPGPLSGRVALVTGASRLEGIGFAVCRVLAERGAAIAFAHHNAADRELFGTPEDEPRDVERRLSELGVRVLPIAADLARAEAAEYIFDRVNGELGSVTILVNNAAWSGRDGIDALSVGGLDRHYAVNMRSPALLCAEFVRRFASQGGGRIINLTSGQDLWPMPGELAYAATKGAIAAFTRSLAAEVAARGITVNAVNPGVTDTGWISGDVRSALLARMPQRRFGMPADAARVIGWLASDEAAWITGQVVNSEGGFTR